MIPHGKFAVTVNGRSFMAIVPLRVVDGIVGVEDCFGTAAKSGRACSADRRFVSTADDIGHAGRAA